jgi:hypothetical protein
MTEPTALSYTPRLGLYVPGFDDELDAERSNWDRLDNTMSGAIWVTPGTIPEDDLLYDGAMIAENGTGKVWRAQKNSSGVYQKHWIKYPWMLQADINYTCPSGTTLNENGWGHFEPIRSINSDSSALVGGRVVVPVSGLYQICNIIRWSALGGAAGAMIVHTVGINATQDVINTEIVHAPLSDNTCVTVNQMNRYLQAGDSIVTYLWQNTGATANYTSIIRVILVRPVS